MNQGSSIYVKSRGPKLAFDFHDSTHELWVDSGPMDLSYESSCETRTSNLILMSPFYDSKSSFTTYKLYSWVHLQGIIWFFHFFFNLVISTCFVLREQQNKLNNKTLGCLRSNGCGTTFLCWVHMIFK